MSNHRTPTRRHVIGAALAAPFVLRVGRALADELAPKIGQMFLVGFHGKTASSAQARALANDIEMGRAGGALFLGHNIGSRQALLAMNDAFTAGHGLRPMIAVDQEGGKVQRIKASRGVASIPAARRVAQKFKPREAYKLYMGAGQDLKKLGFNLNLAPVVDLHDSQNPVIGKFDRAFSDDPTIVAAYAGAFIRGFRSAGVLCAIKHFPGHGFSNADSHDGFVDINRTWESKELDPFAKLIKAGVADIVMAAHVKHRSLGKGDHPITFSSNALNNVLRKKLRHRRLVMTDDLDMGAIRNHYSLREAVIRSVQAGNDLLLLSNSLKPQSELPTRAASWIIDAVGEGKIARLQIEASYKRILSAKRDFSV